MTHKLNVFCMFMALNTQVLSSMLFFLLLGTKFTVSYKFIMIYSYQTKDFQICIFFQSVIKHSSRITKLTCVH